MTEKCPPESKADRLSVSQSFGKSCWINLPVAIRPSRLINQHTQYLLITDLHGIACRTPPALTSVAPDAAEIIASFPDK
jgi:hypothetical protein